LNAICLINQDAEFKVENPQINEPTAAHWAIPIMFPGTTCYVIHLVGDKDHQDQNSLNIFLNAFAHIVVNCDQGLFGEISGERNDDGLGLNNRLELLTKRQREILRLSGEGLTYAQIGNHVGFSESTIKQESMKIFKILGVRNKSEAVAREFNERTY
jgi:DNA-binding CsgD family transcriptional regulator